MTVEVIKVIVTANPGASIGQCIKDAIQIAVTEWRNVQLVHNGKEYIIYVNDILETVKERPC